MIQEQLQQEILSRIDKLAEKLGVTVEYLWPHLVRLTVIEALIGLVVVVGLIIMTAIFWSQYKKADEYKKEGWGIAVIVSGLIAGCGILLVLTLGVPIFLEPEAATLRGLFGP